MIFPGLPQEKVRIMQRIKGRCYLLLAVNSRPLIHPFLFYIYSPFPLSPFFSPPACRPVFLLSFEIPGNNRTVHSTAGLNHRILPCQRDYTHSLVRLELLWRPVMVGGHFSVHICAFRWTFLALIIAATWN